MASVFKILVVRYVDADGRRVKKSTPGAKQRKEKSKKWYGQYRDEHGTVQRVALAADKTAAQSMLNDLVRNVERRQAGLLDPFDEHERRLLTEHVADYERFLLGKADTKQHVSQTKIRIERIIEGCGFRRISDVNAPRIVEWLGNARLERKRFSAQTSNFYQDVIKAFFKWLEEHGRIRKSPLKSLKRLSVDTDRRHDRRSLSDEEFARLIAAAESGQAIEGMSGPDRAMLYIVSCWTGFRRRELSSLTVSSLSLEGEHPTVTVRAGYSKRRRKDTMPLHATVVEHLRAWLTTRDLKQGEPLFLLQLPSGYFRKTAKMMQLDLAAARAAWIAEVDASQERERREASDFLKYQDAEGLFADFHANRHTFISRLGRTGMSLMTAQKLARHSDPRLTANVYTHVEDAEKANAIAGLPELPKLPATTATPGGDSAGSLVALPVALTPVPRCPEESPGGIGPTFQSTEHPCDNPLNDKTFGNMCHQASSLGQVHPTGFEPVTFGSVDRCSIQLS